MRLRDGRLVNPRQGWFDVWQAKGKRALAGHRRPDLHELAALAGYDSPTSALDLTQYDRQLRYVVDSLAIGPADTVYEVGCGAGALLSSLQNMCAGVGGSDFAPALIEVARMVVDSDDLTVHEARSVPARPRYDVVVSNGVFLYFPNAGYAWEVVASMAAKARRAIGVYDVNDLGLQREHEGLRRSAYGPGRSDLGQLYLDRADFWALADKLGMKCLIEDSAITGSVNGRFRYNVMMFHTSPDHDDAPGGRRR
jgi:trans-aconitate methyltransferase